MLPDGTIYGIILGNRAVLGCSLIRSAGRVTLHCRAGNTEEGEKSLTSSDIECYCYFAYLGPFWFIGLLSEKRDNPKLRFHLNQGLLLFIAEVIAIVAVYFLSMLVRLIPYAGGVISALLWLAVIGCAGWLAVKGMLTVASDTKHRLPYIGGFNLLK